MVFSSLRVYENNGKISKFDPALFMQYDKNNNIIGLIAVHVDDFLCTGENSFLESISTKLRKLISVGKEEQKCFRFLGLNVQSKSNKILLDQNHYICNISKTLLSSSRKNDSLKLNENEKKALQEKIGQLLWVCNQTRPDISFETSNIASNLKNAATSYLKLCNKVSSNITDDRLTLK